MTAPRHECPDRMLITSGWSWTSTPITTGTHRPHPTLQQDPLGGRACPPADVVGMRVLRRDRPGGLICEYAQVALGDTVSAPPYGHRQRRAVVEMPCP
jgi:hypothetical protein